MLGHVYYVAESRSLLPELLHTGVEGIKPPFQFLVTSKALQTARTYPYRWGKSPERFIPFLGPIRVPRWATVYHKKFYNVWLHDYWYEEDDEYDREVEADFSWRRRPRRSRFRDGNPVRDLDALD